VLSGLSIVPLCADDNGANNQSRESKEFIARHRVDVTTIFVDSISSDSANGLLGYTYNLTGNSNISAVVPYLDPDFEQGGDSGFGDLLVSFSITPFSKLSANPWVPRTVGSGVALWIPTGSERDGRTLGSFIAMPYLGLVIPMGERFFFAPQVGYVHSFSKTVSGTNYRVLTAETGIAYIAENGFWISYFPQVLRDLESNEWAIDHRLAVGMMFSPRFGMSFDYVFVDRYSFGSNLPVEAGFDEQIELSLHFTF